MISLYSSDSLQDMCLAFDSVKEVIEVTNGNSNVIQVNTAIQINSGIKDVYTITFSKKPTIIQEMITIRETTDREAITITECRPENRALCSLLSLYCSRLSA